MPSVTRWVILTLLLASPCLAQDGQATPLGRIAPPRPDADAGPTRVSIGLYIIDISKINDGAQTSAAS